MTDEMMSLRALLKKASGAFSSRITARPAASSFPISLSVD